MQITNKIYQLSGGMFGNIANIYCIEAEHTLIIIDSGETYSDYQLILRQLSKWNLTKPIGFVLLTHKHLNHVGNAHRFQKAGAKIVIPVKEAEAIEKGDVNQLCDYSPFPLKEEFIPVKADIIAHDLDVLNLDGVKLKCIEAPGHTDGSMIFELESEGKIIWFCGDVFGIAKDCSGATLGWKGGIDYDGQTYLNTILKCSECSVDIILPGHMQCCMQNGSLILKKLLKTALIELRSYTNAGE